MEHRAFNESQGAQPLGTCESAGARTEAVRTPAAPGELTPSCWPNSRCSEAEQLPGPRAGRRPQCAPQGVGSRQASRPWPFAPCWPRRAPTASLPPGSLSPASQGLEQLHTTKARACQTRSGGWGAGDKAIWVVVSYDYSGIQQRNMIHIA